MKETQKTIYDWAKTTFPGEDTQRGRALHVLEEAVELAYAAGIEPHDIKMTALVVIHKCERQDTVNDKEEAADLLACLLAYAEQEKFDVHEMMDNKMEFNRSRPQSYYDKKTKDKLISGFPK